MTLPDANRNRPKQRPDLTHHGRRAGRLAMQIFLISEIGIAIFIR